MKWLILAVVILAQQPAKAPERKGIAEADSAKSTAQTKSAKDHQTPLARPMPVPAQALVAMDSQRSSATTNDHTGTSRQQASDEDRSTQRKLTWFTGVLAGVGVLQLVVMSLTWVIYRRQAREMRRQRHEMRRQRHVMFRQWKAMRGQVAEMKEQTDILKKSVATADKSVEAALKSADAAEKSISVVNSLQAFHLWHDSCLCGGFECYCVCESIERPTH